METVWLYPEREYREIGEERWLVEWYSEKPGVDIDDDSRDLADCYDLNEREYPSRAKARAAAKRIVRYGDTIGEATVKLQRVDFYVEADGMGEWVDVESEVIT